MEKSNTKKTAWIIKWFFAYLNPYRKWIVLCAICSVILSVFSVVKIHFIKVLIDSLTDSRNFSFFYFLVVFCIVLLIIVLSSFGNKYASGKLSALVTRDIQNKYTGHITCLTVKDLTVRHSGDISSRMINDISIIRDFLAGSAVSLILFPLQFIICIIYMISVNWLLALISFSLVPFFILATSLLGNKVRILINENLKYLGEGNAIVSETIRNASVVKIFRLEDILYR